MKGMLRTFWKLLARQSICLNEFPKISVYHYESPKPLPQSLSKHILAKEIFPLVVMGDNMPYLCNGNGKKHDRNRNNDKLY